MSRFFLAFILLVLNMRGRRSFQAMGARKMDHQSPEKVRTLSRRSYLESEDRSNVGFAKNILYRMPCWKN